MTGPREIPTTTRTATEAEVAATGIGEEVIEAFTEWAAGEKLLTHRGEDGWADLALAFSAGWQARGHVRAPAPLVHYHYPPACGDHLGQGELWSGNFDRVTCGDCQAAASFEGAAAP